MVGDEKSRSSSSEETESKLEERAGTAAMSPLVVAVAFVCGRDVRRSAVAEPLRSEGDSGAQQNVSRFHRRQERFSRRFPFCMACDVLENKDHCGKALVARLQQPLWLFMHVNPNSPCQRDSPPTLCQWCGGQEPPRAVTNVRA